MKINLTQNVEDGGASCKCANCAWDGLLDECNEIDQAESRLDPGSVVPAGECPECGALAYLVNEEESAGSVAPGEKDILLAAVDLLMKALQECYTSAPHPARSWAVSLECATDRIAAINETVKQALTRVTAAPVPDRTAAIGSVAALLRECEHLRVGLADMLRRHQDTNDETSIPNDDKWVAHHIKLLGDLTKENAQCSDNS